MIVGSVHFVEFVELMFWLGEVGYDGWLSMDQYPYREEGKAALQGSVEFLQGIEAMLDESAKTEIRDIIVRGEAVEAAAWIRSKLFRR
jgi:xylose isomerase